MRRLGRCGRRKTYPPRSEPLDEGTHRALPRGQADDPGVTFPPGSRERGTGPAQGSR